MPMAREDTTKQFHYCGTDGGLAQPEGDANVLGPVQCGLEVDVVLLHVSPKDEDVIIDGDAASDPLKGFADLVMEDASAVGGAKEEVLHPVEALV